jgi:haloalkane dehalogenase
VLAPDLVGMGRSNKLPSPGPDSYRFAEHRRYLDQLLDFLCVKQRVILVGHDWGGALAFDWALRHPDAVRGIAHMEAIVGPRSWSEVSDFDPPRVRISYFVTTPLSSAYQRSPWS